MKEILATVLTEVKKIPVVGKVVGSAPDKLRAAASVSREAGHAERAQAGVKLEPAWQKLKSRFAEASQNVAEAFQRGAAGASRIMDDSAEKQRMSDAVARIHERAKVNQEATVKTASAAKPAAQDQQENVTPSASFAMRSTSGGLASAVNLIMGRSANELILDETKKQTAELRQINDGIQQLANRAPASAPVARAVDMTPRFA
jgi:hypothetical protein